MIFKKKLFGPLINKVADAANELDLPQEEKMQFKQNIQNIILERQKEAEQAERAKPRSAAEVTTSELRQDDKYTKRARPTIIYVGIALIIWAYAVVPILNSQFELGVPVDIPQFFWNAWAAIVVAYAGGRSVEKVFRSKSKSDQGAVG